MTQTEAGEDPRPDLAARVLPRVTRRLVAFAFICYVVAYIDRVNVGFVSTILQAELGVMRCSFAQDERVRRGGHVGRDAQHVLVQSKRDSNRPRATEARRSSSRPPATR